MSVLPKVLRKFRCFLETSSPNMEFGCTRISLKLFMLNHVMKEIVVLLKKILTSSEIVASLLM